MKAKKQKKNKIRLNKNVVKSQLEDVDNIVKIDRELIGNESRRSLSDRRQ